MHVHGHSVTYRQMEKDGGCHEYDKYQCKRMPRRCVRLHAAMAAPHPDSKAKSRDIHVSPAVLDAARKDGEELLRSLGTTSAGLTQAQAEERAATAGPNEVAQEKRAGLVPPPSENRAQPAGDPAGGFIGDFLRYRRCARRHRDGHDGGAERGTPLHAGVAGGRSGGQAQGHDPRDRNRRSRRQGRRNAAARPGARRHHQAVGGRHDSGRRALALFQGSLREPGQPYRRIAAGREIPRPRRPRTSSSPTELKNICFMGTSVESGTATAVPWSPPESHTYFGSMASSITGERVPTSFDQGVEPLHLADDPV